LRLFLFSDEFGRIKAAGLLLKGDEDMSKARARERAKAKSSKKAKREKAVADIPGQKIRPGQFDPGASSIKGPGGNANFKSFGGSVRGSARSR